MITEPPVSPQPTQAPKPVKKPAKKKKDGSPSVQGEGGGRPMRFKTVAILKKKIEAYFKSCSKPVLHREMKPEIRELLDKKKMKAKDLKDEHYDIVQDMDLEGNLLFEQIRPFTITGLAMELKTDRKTLINYGSREKFFLTIKEAKIKIENYAEQCLFRDKNVTGIIFNLKNNYEWKDQTDVDHTSKGEKVEVHISI